MAITIMGKNYEWISVKDRLPEHDQRVLAFAQGNRDGFWGESKIDIAHIGNIRLFPDSPDCWQWIAPYQYFFAGYEITHWMPLPEGPERESVPLWWIKKKQSEFAKIGSDYGEHFEAVAREWEWDDYRDDGGEDDG